MSRFTDNGDGTVTDNLTRLMWTKNANLAGQLPWGRPKDYLASMNTGLGTYGHNDWRLPNRKELRGQLNYWKSRSSLPETYPYSNVQSDWYWSSTFHSFLSSLIWVFGPLGAVVNLAIGVFYGLKGGYVWPVRS